MNESNFQLALAELLGIEGGYSDIAADRGGKTNWGITESLARSYGYEGKMADLPQAKAEEIYRAEFWDHRRLQLEQLTMINPAAAREIFEQAVNTGVYATAKRCQRVLNVLNRDERLFNDLKIDGWLGNATRGALGLLVAEGDERAVMLWLNIAQGAYYFQLCEDDPTQEMFARGWGLKRVVLK